MQKTLYLLLLLILPFSLQAELYKGVDAEGNTYYSDKEMPNAEKIPMHMPTSVQMPKPEDAKPATEDKSGATSYRSFKIVEPQYNATVRENTGNVSVSLELTPELDIDAGHTITIQLNGKAIIKGLTALTAQLPNVSRGSHGLRAIVKNKNNKTLIVSKKIIFHLKRQSDKPVIKQGPDDPAYKPGAQDPNYRPGPNDPAYKPGPQNPAFKPGPIIPAPSTP